VVNEDDGEGYSVTHQSNARLVSLDTVEVPIVEVNARAGYMRGFNDPEYMESLPTMPVKKDLVRGGNFVNWRIEGDSMNDGSLRSLVDGDIYLCRELDKKHWTSKLFFNDYLFVIVSESDGVVIKQIVKHDLENGVLTCHSFNSYYADFEILISDVKQLFYLYRLVDRRPTPF
jgi:hypothetical protein